MLVKGNLILNAGEPLHFQVKIMNRYQNLIWLIESDLAGIVYPHSTAPRKKIMGN
jgi:hypothetical protein